MTDATPGRDATSRRTQRRGAFVHPMHEPLFSGDLP